jgi:Tfp pilus assembly protein PilO
MKRISKEKKNQLILVLGLTVVAMVGLWFGLINSQTEKLSTLAERKNAAAAKLKQMTTAVQAGPGIKSQLDDEGERLSKLEADMATGDLNSWAFNTIRQFKTPYKLDIPQLSQVDGPKDVTMFPKFPYKQASLTVAGTGLFYDFGRFLADFENRFPYFRVANLSLEPAPQGPGTDPERLAFRMDIIALVKP